MDREVTDAVIKAKNLERSGEWTQEDEVAFWFAFNAVTKAVQPITIESIRAATLMPQRPTLWDKTLKKKSLRYSSDARRSVAKHTVWGLFWVVAMILNPSLFTDWQHTFGQHSRFGFENENGRKTHHVAQSN